MNCHFALVVLELFGIVWQIVMECLTPEQRLKIVEIDFQNQCFVRQNYLPLTATQKTVRTQENVTAIAAIVDENPNLLIRRRSQEVGSYYSTTWIIFIKDLGLVPYKTQLTQELKPQDHRLRRTFAEWSLSQLRLDPEFDRKVLFSDETHFWLNGYFNKQNCRIWSVNNPKVIQQLPLHPEK